MYEPDEAFYLFIYVYKQMSKGLYSLKVVVNLQAAEEPTICTSNCPLNMWLGSIFKTMRDPGKIRPSVLF